LDTVLDGRHFGGCFSLDAIILTTGKSKHRRQALIPLYGELQAVLAAIPRRSTVILTNSLERPWTVNGFGTAFNRAKIAASISDRDLHFHDLRGTAATKFYTAGLSERVIAEIITTLPRSFAAMSVDPRQPRRRSPSLTGRNGEQNLQNRLQNLQANFSLILERAKGIEPSYAAWEAAVLPLNYARNFTLSEQIKTLASFAGRPAGTRIAEL
jgi:Phage integrase family